MIKFDPEPLRALFAQYYDPKHYRKAAKASLGNVVQWRWATGEMLDRGPLYRELIGAPARWLRDKEKVHIDDLQHGFDAEGRILLIRDAWEDDQFDDTRESMTETLCLHEDGNIIAITATPNENPSKYEVKRVDKFVFDGGRMTSAQGFDYQRGHIDSYFWNADRLERRVQLFWQHGMYFPRNPKRAKWEGPSDVHGEQHSCEYDDDGQIARIWWQELDKNGKPDEESKHLSYRRPAKGETIAALSATIEQMLLEQIPQVVAKAKVKAKVYCLLVCYCGEDLAASLPPFLVLGSEKERQRILKEGSDVSYSLWAPDEMREKRDNFELGLSDKTLVAKCKIHRQLMSVKSNYSSVKKLLQNVVHKLNDHPWGKTLKTTPDFIVAYVDNTCEIPFKKDIKASISEERFADLTTRGLI